MSDRYYDEQMAELAAERAASAELFDNDGQEPVVSGDGQDILGGSPILGADQWDNSNTYEPGALVSYDGKIYKAVQHIDPPLIKFFGDVPSTSSAWTAVAGDVLGDVIEEVVGYGVGPMEFHGPEDYIRGETACLRGCDIVGSAPGTPLGKKIAVQRQPVGFVHKVAPGGNSYLAVGTKPTGGLDNTGSVKTAKVVAQNAQKVASVLKNFKTTSPNVSPAKPHGATKVSGPFDDIEGDEIVGVDWVDIVGVTPRGRKVAKTVALPTDAKIRSLAGSLKSAGTKLSSQADTHANKVTSIATATAQGAKQVAAKTQAGLGGQKVHGIIGANWRDDIDQQRREDVLGYDYEINGAAYDLLGADPDPNNPGYLTDGTLDPNYQGGGAAPPTDTSSLPAGPDTNYGLDPAPTAPPPLVPGQDFVPDSALGGGYMTDTTVYDSSPYGCDPTKMVQGAVIFDGRHPFNHLDVGSFVAYHGGGTAGEGVEPEPANSDDYKHGVVSRGGFRWHNDGWWYNWGGDNQRPGAGDYGKATNAGDVSGLSAASQSHHWGPIVGNPTTDFKGLRFDVCSKQWFWPYDVAPAWATSAMDTARFSKAILDYQSQLTAAKTDYLQSVAQAKSDQAAADAQNKQIATDQINQQSAQQAADAADAITLSHSSAAQQAAQMQIDTAQAQAQQQQEAAQAQFELEQQKADLAAQQQQMSQPQGGYADQGYADQGGGGGGTFDDVEPDANPADYGSTFDDMTQ